MTHVLLFGDSISYGLFDEGGGWAQRIRARIDLRNQREDGYWTHLYNLGISGETTTGTLKRIEAEISTRKEGDSREGNVVIFALGTNDAVSSIEQNTTQVAPDIFRSNVRALTSIASKHASRIAFIGLFPVYEPATNPLPWASGMALRNETLREFNQIIASICEQSGARFFDLGNVWEERESREFLQDGIHPNSRGHQKLAAAIATLFTQYDLL